MKHTIGDIKAGTDVWMIFTEMHKTKPLLVTVLEDNISTEYMMPRKNIEVHPREGLNKQMEPFIPLKHFAFCNEICYDTEEEAQTVLNQIIIKQEEVRNELRKKIINYANSYIIENNLVFADKSERNTFINGYVACAMEHELYASLEQLKILRSNNL